MVGTTGGAVEGAVEGAVAGAVAGTVAGTTDVLNGIAYDAQADRLFVTGKLWPKLFEIKVIPEPAKPADRKQPKH